jgi:protein tyrosine phosphatase (PTP) superfamily phosphohydrolase (DUF442 family)
VGAARRVWYAVSTRIYGPAASCRGYSWIGDERIAIGAMPLDDDFDALEADGVTHVVNCRARTQGFISQDLWREQEVFGPDRVRQAPMWDNGRRQSPSRWAEAAEWAARVLDEDPDALVLVHCQQGRRRSAMVTYAILRLRGRDANEAARLILTYRPVARIVPAYRASVEDWLARRLGASSIR